MSEIAETRRALAIASALAQIQPHELYLALTKLGISGFFPEAVDHWQYDSYCYSLVGSLTSNDLGKLADLYQVKVPANSENRSNPSHENSKSRLFISYQSEDSKSAGDLARALGNYGFDAFVAHDDIEKGLEWRRQLQNNLNQSNALICLIGSKYPSSAMCNQEIGWALARRIPVIPCLLDSKVKPSEVGFAEEFQFFRFNTPEQLARESLRYLFKLETAETNFISNFVDLVCESPDFDRLLLRWGLLRTIETLPEEALNRLALASERNPQFGRVNKGTFKPQMLKSLETWNQPRE